MYYNRQKYAISETCFHGLIIYCCISRLGQLKNYLAHSCGGLLPGAFWHEKNEITTLDGNLIKFDWRIIQNLRQIFICQNSR